MRAQEARALDRVIGLLREAETGGPRSREGIHALYQLRTLWTVFLDDLNGPENALPTPLRARLISIGIWVDQGNRAAALRRGRASSPRSSRSTRSSATD